MKNIVVAIDFTEISPVLINQGMHLANAFNASMWLIHVAPPDPDFVGYEVGPQSVRDNIAQQYRNEHKLLQQLADNTRKKGVTVTSLLLQGPTAEAIIKEAEHIKADVIIVGSNSHADLRHTFIGSVSKAIVKNSKIPVLFIPE